MHYMMVERDIMVPMRWDQAGVRCLSPRGRRADRFRRSRSFSNARHGKGQTSRLEISRHHPEHPKSRQEVRLLCPTWLCGGHQDCRGRYGSEGVFEKYLAEAPDGYDTCAWLVQQSCAMAVSVL